MPPENLPCFALSFASAAWPSSPCCPLPSSPRRRPRPLVPRRPRPIRALLVIGGCCHDYAKQKDILTKGISARANVEWTIAYDPDTTTKHLNPVYEKPDWAKGFDVIVHDECCSDVKDLAVINRILEPHREGLPAVVLHCGMHCYRSEGWPKIDALVRVHRPATTGHGAAAPIAVTFVDKDSPITKGLKDWTTINEELYNNITGKLLDTAHPLARGKQTIKGRRTHDYVVVWTNIYKGKTKVFATTLGHNNATVARRALPRPGHARPALVGRQARRRPPEAGPEAAAPARAACAREVCASAARPACASAGTGGARMRAFAPASVNCLRTLFGVGLVQPLHDHPQRPARPERLVAAHEEDRVRQPQSRDLADPLDDVRLAVRLIRLQDHGVGAAQGKLPLLLDLVPQFGQAPHHGAVLVVRRPQLRQLAEQSGGTRRVGRPVPRANRRRPDRPGHPPGCFGSPSPMPVLRASLASVSSAGLPLAAR